MAKYGISYVGSKSKIAEDILQVLPRGKRFVDLFGGGFAMSHAALLSGKYEQVLYNELNPLIFNLINNALDGKYDGECRWIGPDKFKKFKGIDGFVSVIWGYGSDLNGGYLYGNKSCANKRAWHNFCLFGKDIPGVPNIAEKDVRKRRLYLAFLAKKNNHPGFGRLEHLQRLERLQCLKFLKRPLMNCGSYLDYQYQWGDVVYCDPPYETRGKYYTQDFDFKKFCDWVASRPYPVYFSSYKIDDPRFYVIWKKEKLRLLNQRGDKIMGTEYLYCNMPPQSKRILFEVKK